MQIYSKEYFIDEVLNFYKKNRKIPKSKDFSWSATARKYFGSWEILIEESSVKDLQEQDKKKREEYLDTVKEIEWTLINTLTYDKNWINNQTTVNKVSKLRRSMEKRTHKIK